MEIEAAASTLRTQLLPAFRTQKAKADRVDRWHRWDHDLPYTPSNPDREFRQLSERAPTAWGTLVVTAVAQGLFVEGYRATDAAGDSTAWKHWQRNQMDSRQAGLHRAALTYGMAFALVTPGEDEFTGEPVPRIRGMSPRRMIALYEDNTSDVWPQVALRIEPGKSPVDGRNGWECHVIDDQHITTFWTGASASDKAFEFLRQVEHGLGVCPVVKYSNISDLDGRAIGEIEPIVSILARIDQTTMDRIMVQRFSSWKVRTISGMELPDKNTDAEKLRLSMEDILVAKDADTKFGTLDETPLDGFIKAKDSDIRDLAAVSQTPPHHLLGQMANLSAEALVAAESALSAKKDERQHSFGESHEQTLRLAAHVAGETAAAADFESQVVWKDTQSRSLAQAADAIQKLKAAGVPLEILLEKIPSFSKGDIERIGEIAKNADSSLDALLNELAAGQNSAGLPA